jgi:hypothetical protein
MTTETIVAYPGEGTEPADAWFYQRGGRWMAVRGECEGCWFEDGTCDHIPATSTRADWPTVRVMPITETPAGTLTYRTWQQGIELGDGKLVEVERPSIELPDSLSGEAIHEGSLVDVHHASGRSNMGRITYTQAVGPCFLEYRPRGPGRTCTPIEPTDVVHLARVDGYRAGCPRCTPVQP